MAKHDELLQQGPHEAPEPETAEERSHRLGMKSAGGAIVGGGAIAAKTGILAKTFLWLFAWNGVHSAWRIGGWIGLAVVALIITAYFVLRSRRQA